MADITMRRGEGYPLREACLRHKAQAHRYPSYFYRTPYNQEHRYCDHHWPMGSRAKKEPTPTCTTS